ncbi:hypothetical protein QN219_19970 [Sinorhizobium sp. 7-81]|uniref:hypothetical protein n=1 Tax=Sinorhizobium sp. 8-89 TaxID=3049089 RepID=UPI0024C25262|nr:hypothetical protein [Sinorhizobium sp. 8-89]MDK1492314.1 hypothetical protein [Sinorhizobium sp. 8-89]
MATTEFHSGHAAHASDIVHALTERLENIAAAIATWHRHTQTLKAIESLNRDELKDIGYPADARDPKPVIEIKTGQMTTLMSMR